MALLVQMIGERETVNKETRQTNTQWEGNPWSSLNFHERNHSGLAAIVLCELRHDRRRDDKCEAVKHVLRSGTHISRVTVSEKIKVQGNPILTLMKCEQLIPGRVAIPLLSALAQQ
jgi:hypothetical protein